MIISYVDRRRERTNNGVKKVELEIAQVVKVFDIDLNNSSGLSRHPHYDRCIHAKYTSCFQEFRIDWI